MTERLMSSHRSNRVRSSGERRLAAFNKAVVSLGRKHATAESLRDRLRPRNAPKMRSCSEKTKQATFTLSLLKVSHSFQPSRHEFVLPARGLAHELG